MTVWSSSPSWSSSRWLIGAALPAVALLAQPAAADPQVQSRKGPTLTVEGRQFRDLDRSGRLDPYEDWRLSPEQRTDDLVRRMTLEEKAGTMMHASLPGAGSGANAAIGVSADGYDLARVGEMIGQRGITSFITRLALPPRRFAEANNAVQQLGEDSRLGIPVTISTDPRNHFQYVLGSSAQSKGFSQWPDPLGFGAIGDPKVVRTFADIARQEYRAVGIHEALSPQADLATEPRWSRMTGTFGSNPALVSPLVAAYVEGFQHGSNGVARDGVMTIVKHWVGYGAEPDGFDAHNYYGRTARLNDRSFAAHVAAFDGAFRVNVAGVMPTYPILEGVTIDGTPLEQVGAGFNRQLLTGLLRDTKGYRGIILSDWAITNDCGPGCRAPDKPQGVRDIAMPWGVETVSEAQRFEKGIVAGLDHFGGVDKPAAIITAVRAGRIAEARIDDSVRRIMIAKFEQGLFDNPYVDPAAAERFAARPEHQRMADAAQRRSQVLLENRSGALPLTGQRRVFIYGLSPDAVNTKGFTVVARPEDADVAIIRMEAPSEMLHPTNFFGSRQKEGRLDFRDGDAGYEALKTASAHVPTIVSVYLDRPAILTNVRDKAAVLLANFGVSDAALMDVLTGRARASGRLPFELPSSMAAVSAQDPAVPDDSAKPLYAVGAGIGGAVRLRR